MKKQYSCPRSTPFEDRFAEARGKEFLAFGLKSAGGGRSSNLFQGNTYPESIIPVLHYSNILAGVKRALEWSKKYV